ncbi:MAG: phospho-N-acetylmuramoyl-pentapeptide-transferase, partial [Candidatus Cloacimonadota bacterium]|nr:phospho-N-acetylmuramoyl-pentapeptide-transferase [Candidatus Cloacimonadota bacterium]
MFYHIFEPLANTPIFGYNIFNVFQYVTFRAIASFITALLFSLLIGPLIIRVLKKNQFVESISEYLPRKHHQKKGTPTMGGLIVLSGLLLSSFLWNNLVNTYVLIMFLTAIWLSGIGFLDDYLKNIKHTRKGLIAKYKLMAQILLGLIIACMLYFGTKEKAAITSINLPFMKDTVLQLGWFFIPFVVFMVVGTSNAVNLTDGLDGLATGVVVMSVFGLGVMTYLKGNFVLADHLNLDFVENAGELAVFSSALMGTLLGFLWFNSKPAQIFLGDTGSLALGGILAVLSVLLR